jgi:hypothetical protein
LLKITVSRHGAINIKLPQVQIGFPTNAFTGSSSASLQMSFWKPRLNCRSAWRETDRPRAKGARKARIRRRFVQRISQKPCPFVEKCGIGRRDMSNVLAARNAPAIAHAASCFGLGFRSSTAELYTQAELEDDDVWVTSLNCSRRKCPAGRAACAAGGHFVACLPVSARLGAWGLALLGVRLFD